MVSTDLQTAPSPMMDADGLSRPCYRHQWVRVASSGVETDIPRGRSATYRMVAEGVGAAMKVRATFTDDKGNPELAERALTAAVPLPRWWPPSVPVPTRQRKAAQPGCGSPWTRTRAAR